MTRAGVRRLSMAPLYERWRGPHPLPGLASRLRGVGSLPTLGGGTALRPAAAPARRGAAMPKAGQQAYGVVVEKANGRLSPPNPLVMDMSSVPIV